MRSDSTMDVKDMGLSMISAGIRAGENV